MPEHKDETNDDEGGTKVLFIIIGILVIIVAVFFALVIFNKPSGGLLTIDELHQLNMNGKLEPEEGYIYNGFSFVNLGGIWYSNVQKGNTIYDITFNNGPKDVDDIVVEGVLSSRFNSDELYITFDPNATYANYIAVANAGLSMGLVKGFGYQLTAGCTSNQSSTCLSTKVITCEDSDEPVIYFKEDPETKITLNDNCVTVQGLGPEIVRAKDRLLMRWYGIMD
ncbi:hypothetical protein HQ545_08945 [Candidatus Woesearchaeota archaeon]|nr:hypothetical protein [Candidatus Woesearchaeota archaeon]